MTDDIQRLFPGIVIGNITDEEVEDMVPPTDTGKEYPLQRDEVQTTLSKINHNIIGKIIVGST